MEPIKLHPHSKISLSFFFLLWTENLQRCKCSNRRVCRLSFFFSFLDKRKENKLNGVLNLLVSEKKPESEFLLLAVRAGCWALHWWEYRSGQTSSGSVVLALTSPPDWNLRQPVYWIQGPATQPPTSESQGIVRVKLGTILPRARQLSLK